MSINFCTIGKVRIDGFCGSQRAKVLARLIHEAGHDTVVVPSIPPRGHSGGAIVGNFKPQPFPSFRPTEPQVDRNLPPVEQPYITVRAEIFGMFGSETVETVSRLDFVVVTDLEIGSEVEVNISEMEI